MQLVSPLRAERIYPAPGVIADEVEFADTTKIGTQIQAKAKVILAPAFLLNIDQQYIAITLRDDAVIESFEVATPNEPRQITFDFTPVKRLAGEHGELRTDGVGAGIRAAFDTNFVNA